MNKQTKINELEEENSLLLLQLHQVQEELERYYLENLQLKKIKTVEISAAHLKTNNNLLYGAGDRARNWLSYRMGNIIITNTKSLKGILSLPWLLITEVKNHRNKRQMSEHISLPPISSYADAYEVDRIKAHLSYRLGKALIDCSKTPLGWIKMPLMLYLAYRNFKYDQKDKNKTPKNKQQFSGTHKLELTRRVSLWEKLFCKKVLDELSAMQASHAQLEKDKDAAEDVNNLLQEMQKKLITQQKKLSNNAVLQIESYMRLQNYVADDIVLPDMHGWPISPDSGMQLVQMIETGNYDAVVEFGSGVSTLLMALALKKQAKKSIAMPTKLIAFEHLAAYFEQTKKLLSASGLNANVTLIHAKLISIKGLNQTNFDYYDCLEALKQFKKELKIPNPKIMVFVDGPPGATGPHARYPAMQSIEQVFEGSAYVDYLMDDYMRKEECEIVSMWEQHFNDQGREVEKKEYLALEKQACVLSVKAFQKASKFINKTEIDSKYEK